MSVWTPPSTEEEPEISLAYGTIVHAKFEDRTSSLHFVGTEGFSSGGRVSSKIVSVDVISSSGVTKSGRKYCIRYFEPQISGGDVRYTWARWVSINDVIDAKEVSFEEAARILGEVRQVGEGQAEPPVDVRSSPDV